MAEESKETAVGSPAAPASVLSGTAIAPAPEAAATGRSIAVEALSTASPPKLEPAAGARAGVRWPTLIAAALLGLVFGVLTTVLVRKPLIDETRFVNFDANSRELLGDGWSGAEGKAPDTYTWCAAQQCAMTLLSRATGDRVIAFQLSPFTYPGAPQQSLELVLNGTSLGVFKAGGAMSMGRLTAPQAAWRIGSNELLLKFGYATSPKSLSSDGSGDGRTLSAALVWLAVGGSDPVKDASNK